MLNATKFIGPPLEIDLFEKSLAKVKEVAISPSSSFLSEVPSGKDGSTGVNEATNSFGNA